MTLGQKIVKIAPRPSITVSRWLASQCEATIPATTAARRLPSLDVARRARPGRQALPILTTRAVADYENLPGR